MTALKLIDKLGQTATQNRDEYWNYQRQIGHFFLKQYFNQYEHGKTILDIGCGEGGVLAEFAENGYECFGLEINEQRLEYARLRYGNKIHLLQGNIEDFNCSRLFDLVIMSDVIEHIVQKEKALLTIKNCLKNEGLALITFPPYRSAFGGHQQTLNSFLKYIPFWHLFPRRLYIQLFKWFEPEHLESRLEIYDNGLTIKEFELLIQKVDFQIIRRFDYLIRPRQSLRFGLPIRENRFPLLKEYLTTGVCYLLKRIPVETNPEQV